jgi:3',5'-cyclic AMP phosphodiesterase CpdA
LKVIEAMLSRNKSTIMFSSNASMRVIHLSDIHVWRYTWDLRRLASVRALGVMELLLGRARRFQLDRLKAVVERVVGLGADHILITGDLTTTALPSEFRESRRLLAPLLRERERVSIVPGNHDRTTVRSFASRRFEGTFGAYMPSPEFPWIRRLDGDTAILGLDPTGPHIAARGKLPPEQLEKAGALTADREKLPRHLIVACHYPVAAPVRYQRELFNKRLQNDEQVRAWLATIGPHLYCCGHVHAAWVFRPPALPEQICINAGAPLMHDPTGLRLPGFMEIALKEETVTVTHHAWTGADWQCVPMLQPATPLAAAGAVT